MRLHLCVLRKDQTGQQRGTLLWRQRTQDVLEQQLRQQQLVAADLTSHTSLQLHCSAAVDVLEGLKDLRKTRGEISVLRVVVEELNFTDTDPGNCFSI